LSLEIHRVLLLTTYILFLDRGFEFLFTYLFITFCISL